MPRSRRSRRAALVLAGGLAPTLAVGAPAAHPGAGTTPGKPAVDAPPPHTEPPRSPHVRGPAHRKAFGERVLRVASRYAGVPYVAGGTTPRGFDCSGYTRFVYGRAGRHIPRVSHDQFRHARKVGRDVRRGELVFFRSGGTGRVYHVGIYAGRGRIWHAPSSGEHVRRDKIWTGGWSGGHY